MKQPLLGRPILWLCLPQSERESIPGDLIEEFATRGTISHIECSAICDSPRRRTVPALARAIEGGRVAVSFYVPVSLGVSAVCTLIGWLYKKRIGGKQ